MPEELPIDLLTAYEAGRAETLADSARLFCEAGLAIFPLLPRDKKPFSGEHRCEVCTGDLIHRRGFYDASTDPATIEAWWEAHPDANIGYQPGQSGILLIDLDGVLGKDTWATMEAMNGDVTTTTVVTPGKKGGRHLWFVYPKDAYIGQGELDAKIDYRGAVGYAVLPPSIHPETSTPYSWGVQHSMASSPAWLVKRLERRRDRPAEEALNYKETLAYLEETRVDMSERGQQHVDRLVDEMRNREGRHVTLMRCIAQMVGISVDLGIDVIEGLKQLEIVFDKRIAADPGRPDQPNEFMASVQWIVAQEKAKAGEEDEPDPKLSDEDADVLTRLAKRALAFDEIDDDEWEAAGLDPSYAFSTLVGVPDVPRPDILHFDHSPDLALFYRGRVNGIYGEPGTGKSYIVAYAASQVLKAGGRVLWYDYEDPTVSGLLKRLERFGVSPAQMANLRHQMPKADVKDPRRRAFIAQILPAIFKPDLLVVDSLGEAFGVEGINENNDDEVGPWIRATLRSMAEQADMVEEAPAVVFVDHAAKGSDAPKLYPSGSKRKAAAIGGSLFRVNSSPSSAPDKARAGAFYILCAKDRFGGWHRGEDVGRLWFDLPVRDLSTGETSRRVELQRVVDDKPVGIDYMEERLEIARAVVNVLGDFDEKDSGLAPTKAVIFYVRKTLPDITQAAAIETLTALAVEGVVAVDKQKWAYVRNLTVEDEKSIRGIGS